MCFGYKVVGVNRVRCEKIESVQYDVMKIFKCATRRKSMMYEGRARKTHPLLFKDMLHHHRPYDVIQSLEVFRD